MQTLTDRLKGSVAVVTGASRGVGKGIALALGDAGATVYVTGRTVTAGSAPLPGSVGETAAEVTTRGGRGVAVACDHADDAQVRALFERVKADQGRLDVLVNNVFAVPDGTLSGVEFWNQPIAYWDTMHGVGLRSHYVASVYAAPLMVAHKRGLVATISSFGAHSFALNVAYSVGKAAVDRLAADMAHDFAPHGVVSVALWPGIVRTERVLAERERLPFDLSRSESAEFTGRAVVALACDPDAMKKSGRTLVVGELAKEYDFTDVDGTQPRPFKNRSPENRNP